MKNINFETGLNPKYEEQQNAIKKVCSEFGYYPYYPNYHADRRDNNTVIIYASKAESDKDGQRICELHNSDVNGNFDLNFMCYGKVDFRGIVSSYEKIKTYIQSSKTK